MVRRSLSHGLRAWLAVVGGFSLRMMGRFLCVAWSAFGLVSVTIVRFGYEGVACRRGLRPRRRWTSQAASSISAWCLIPLAW